jgi:ABC-2 type transport system permease protein
MKNSLWSLYLSLLNVNYGWSAGKYYYIKKRQRIWEPIIIAASIGPTLVMAVWFMWALTEQLFLGGLAFGQPHLALVTGTLMVSILSLFFGFFYVLSAFYFGNDLPLLLPLPLRSWEILVAKLGVILTGQYVLNALFLLPMGIRYGLLAQTGLGYVLSAIVVFLVLPVIPLVIASILAVLLMRFVNLSRYKDKLTLIGGILLLVVVLGSTYWMQESFGTDDPTALMEQLLSQADGLIVAVGRVFPPSVWAAQAMAYGHNPQGWLNLLYLVLCGILGLAILYLLGEKVFMQGVIAGLEGSRGTGKRKRLGANQEAGNLFVTLVSIERKLFLRDPNFALNGLVGYVLLPVMALLPLFGQNLEKNPFATLNLGEINSLLIIGGIALFFMIMTSFSMIPSTTFSREGRYLWIIRSLPLSISQIIGARVVAAQVVNTIGCLLGLVPIAYFFGWGVLEVVFGTVFGILLASVVAFLLALLDLSRPMLDWVNPVKAVKSNLNAIIGTFGSLALGFLLGLLFFFNRQTGTLWLIPLELGFVTALFAGLARLLVTRVAPRLWTKI